MLNGKYVYIVRSEDTLAYHEAKLIKIKRKTVQFWTVKKGDVLMNEIEILAITKEIEKAERELQAKRRELCSLEMFKEYNDELDFLEEEKEIADYYAASKAKRGNRRKQAFNAKRKREALAKSIYGKRIVGENAINDALSFNHAIRNDGELNGSGGYVRTKREKHVKKTEFSKEVAPLEYVPEEEVEIFVGTQDVDVIKKKLDGIEWSMPHWCYISVKESDVEKANELLNKAEPSELAVKLYEFCLAYDPYEARDLGITVDVVEENLNSKPNDVINWLVDVASEMLM